MIIWQNSIYPLQKSPANCRKAFCFSNVDQAFVRQNYDGDVFDDDDGNDADQIGYLFVGVNPGP
jgi:hypothetical protein